MVRKAFAVLVAGTLLAVPFVGALAHNRSFSDPKNDVTDNASDLKRVTLLHDGNRYTFKATIWNDFRNRSMKPGRGVSWRLDTMDAPGKFEFDHDIVLNWMRYHGRKQYRCRVFRYNSGNFVGNFPGRRNDNTVVCPGIRKSEWGGRRVHDWDVLSFFKGGLDGSGAHPH